MTQHEKILRYMVKHPKSGMTIRDGFIKLNINWVHKRIAELEEMGVKVKRLDESREGVAFRRYILQEPDQPRIAELLELFEGRRKADAERRAKQPAEN